MGLSRFECAFRGAAEVERAGMLGEHQVLPELVVVCDGVAKPGGARNTRQRASA